METKETPPLHAPLIHISGYAPDVVGNKLLVARKKLLVARNMLFQAIALV